MGLSYITVYAISKSRTGTAAAVSTLLQRITQFDLVLILITILLSGIISFFLGIKLAKTISKIFNKLSYKYLTLSIILIVLVVNIIFTNWLGIIVLMTSTALGIFAILSNSRGINLMACLIVPAIVYYLFS